MTTPPRKAATVLPAYLHPGNVSQSFSDSLVRLIAHHLTGERVAKLVSGTLALACGSGGLVQARNQVARYFLDETDADWLWMVDSDMGFQPDTIERLVAVADPVERPVVGGLCFGVNNIEPDGMGGLKIRPFPTLYEWVNKPDGTLGWKVRRDYPPETLVQVGGTGAACLLVHRSALEKVRADAGDAWFDRAVLTDGTLVGEDLSFCFRLAKMSIPLFIHTGVKTTHHKQIWIGEDEYRLLSDRAVVRPATEPVTVIVPVMRRPHNAAPFMQSLRASTGLATVFAVADMEDRETAEAWKSAGAVVLDCAGSEPGTFARKVNIGAAEASTPWLFLAGDDVRFHPGWLDHAQSVAGDQYHVIGTNDLANTRVAAGEHATHMLIRTSYVDEVGASWDGPKVVAHEGYGHWYVDDEIVTAAKRRGVWAMALASIVEHLHPLVGTAANDEVYELGQAKSKQDYARFRQRLATHAPELAHA